MNRNLQKENFLNLKANESRIWSIGWSVALSEGLIDIIWGDKNTRHAEGLRNIAIADQTVSHIISRTVSVAQESKQPQSDKKLLELGQRASLIWDDYYAHTARLLSSVTEACIAMTWGEAGAEILNARMIKSNFRRPTESNKVIWDKLRSSRNDRRALQDSLFDEPNPLRQTVEPLYQAYFYHSNSINTALRKYSAYQDSLWHLASLSPANQSEETVEAGEKALRAVFKITDNFHEALRPATLRLLKEFDSRVPPGDWVKAPKSVPHFAYP